MTLALFGIENDGLNLAVNLLVFFLFVIYVALVYWTYADASRRLEDPLLVAEQMARLRRLAYRIVWVNPRKAAPGYAPLVGGMAAALPYCDALVSGHSLAALTEVVDVVGAGRGETVRRGGIGRCSSTMRSR